MSSTSASSGAGGQRPARAMARALPPCPIHHGTPERECFSSSHRTSTATWAGRPERRSSKANSPAALTHAGAPHTDHRLADGGGLGNGQTSTAGMMMRARIIRWQGSRATIQADGRKWLGEDRRCLEERHAVLVDVCDGFVGVPLEVAFDASIWDLAHAQSSARRRHRRRAVAAN